MTWNLNGIDLTTEVVRTERLVLRPYRPDDVDAVFAACQAEDIRQWIFAMPSPYTRDDAREFVTEAAPGARASGRALIVAVEADGALVGSSGVHFGDGKLGPEIGYWIAREARGHGYAAETAHALAEWALTRGAPRVHLVADVRNVPSLATARRAGFTQEGVLRSCLPYRDGSRGDAALFSRLPSD